MGRNLRRQNKIKMLKKIFKRGKEEGKWKVQGDLMSEILHVHPSRLDNLVGGDLDLCLSFGNYKLESWGLDQVKPAPEDDPGRCEDLWDGDDDLPCLVTPEPAEGGFVTTTSGGIDLADLHDHNEDYVFSEEFKWSDTVATFEGTQPEPRDENELTAWKQEIIADFIDSTPDEPEDDH
jgi:hypothetical protein